MIIVPSFIMLNKFIVSYAPCCGFKVAAQDGHFFIFSKLNIYILIDVNVSFTLKADRKFRMCKMFCVMWPGRIVMHVISLY